MKGNKINHVFVATEISRTTKLAKQSNSWITKGLEGDARRIMCEAKEVDLIKFPELYYVCLIGITTRNAV